ncbi:MAG: 50S ribosomal protein L21 [Oligoflexia bacterium]|nr:50S ribosomal protein L21 [Oligoflexia bacterium]
MYAVIETGGKQYRVQPGDIVEIEKLASAEGSSINFDKILLLSTPGADNSKIVLGKPYVNGASVQAEIVGQGRGEKVMIVKMKRRKQYRRTQGHRQEQTQILITEVNNGAGEKLSLDAAAKKERLAKFITNLKPRGLASTPKTLGSRKRLAAAAKATAAAAPAAKTKAKKGK